MEQAVAEETRATTTSAGQSEQHRMSWTRGPQGEMMMEWRKEWMSSMEEL
jgi:hypothetical protein